MTDNDRRSAELRFHAVNTNGEGWAPGLLVELDYRRCPNEACHQHSLEVNVRDSFSAMSSGRGDAGGSVVRARLLPRSVARVLPPYVPIAVRQDYEEACAIRDLSPKASATLSRRCLQTMVRDFHGVSRRTLAEEINAIKDQVDAATWDNIEGVRAIGNIGAHMTSDRDVITEVEPHEAALLISVIENLIDEWYVAQHERETRNSALRASVESKRPGPAS